jgi:hypothetical protein
LRSSLKAFNYRVSDELLSAALTGQEINGVPQSAELLISKAKNKAKLDLPSYSQYIDEGFTIEDIFEPFKDIAVKTLELNPIEVSLNEDRYMRAIKGKPDGSPYSANEWVHLLKTDPEYKWQFTNQANQQVSSMVSTLERACGLVR